MPRQRRVPRTRVGGVTPEQKQYFLNPFSQVDPREPFPTSAEAREVWQAYRDDWMPEARVAYRRHSGLLTWWEQLVEMKVLTSADVAALRRPAER